MGSTANLKEAEAAVMEAYGVDFDNRFIDLERPQLRARVLEVGEGDPVLMVHGAFDVASKWAPLMAELTGRKILAVDLPGYGLTDPFVYERGRLREVGVDFLESVVDSLGLESVPLIANSMGGLWAFWLALDRPSRVRAIVQVACPGMLLGTSAPLPFRLLSVRGLNRVLLRAMPDSGGRGELKALGDERAAETAPQEFVDLLEASSTTDHYWRTSLSLLEAAARIRGGRVTFTERQLAAIHHPTLFVWGESDPFGSPEVGRFAASIMSRGRFVGVGGGHMPWAGAPGDVADPIRRFLDTDLEMRQPGDRPGGAGRM